MEFSLDSLDGFPQDSDILETSEGHVTDSPTKKTSPKICVTSKDEENAIVSYHKYGTSTKAKEREGRTDNNTVFNELESNTLSDTKISLEKSQKYHEMRSDFSKTTSDCSPSSTCSTPEIIGLQKCPDHRQCGTELALNKYATSSLISASQTDRQEDLLKLATPTRGDRVVGVVSHHPDLSPWERWVVQKAHQERERREEQKLSYVSGQFCLPLFP